ncbi:MULTISPECIES: hypothetical protein [Rhodobacterales]|uniref:hypothetical protein n=1 Tax=Rhodobacterales TaxID=204455 RepID=UPI001C6889E2|nr:MULTISPECIES: hypothetical protein [Rhodobacterales]MDO6591842.1 hypothetical protein [Yoonia sp. 1_MG-2023]
MHEVIETRGDLTCEVDANEATTEYQAILKYKGYEQGRFSGRTLAAVREQFAMIADYIDVGSIVRGGVILTGYFNGDFKGDVLSVDGEVLGAWHSDDEEWCYLTLTGMTEHELAAPSPWMLHDSIIDLYRDANSA